ncbi:SMI1/KNR4 family protein [Streptomyces sp. NPDC051917]|uniref:SMI1/KNR4 family protein n=1 Tax=Streptomyces sp. NPDC051917 TaxID=3154754 RepID=UPI00344EAB86
MTDDEVLAAVEARVQTGRPTDLRDRLFTPAPASAEALAEAERIIGYPLPPLLRRLYTEVANGGFGPFGGIEGLRNGYTSDGPSMLEMYLQYDEPDPEPEAPPAPPHGVLLFCDHGCAMWSLLDCRQTEGQMWWWDQGERHKCDLTLREWLGMWLEGKLEHGIPGDLALEDDESWYWPEADDH